tara:strand:+ start:5740 stop:6318 length:579 start_codon:yes stop_codon:yes gene_type:complete
MGKTSYDIASEARHLAAELMDIADADGVVDDERYDAWVEESLGIYAETRDKLQALKAVKLRLSAEADILKTDAKAIAQRAKRLDDDVKRLVGYQKDLLLAHRELHPGVDKVDTTDGSYVRLTERKRYEVAVPDWVVVDDHTMEKWFAERPPPKPDKRAITRAVADGVVTADDFAEMGIEVEVTTIEHVQEGR